MNTNLNNKRNKKKGNMKRKGRNNRNTGYSDAIPKLFGFIKPRETVVLKYFDFITLTIATVTVSDYIFRLNSLFDPDQTGTGHQPYGRDSLAALFNRYRVDKVDWRITLPSSSGSFSCLVVPVNGAFAPTTLADFTLGIELPYASYRAISSGGAPPAVFMRSIDLPRLNGAKRAEYNTDDRFQAQMGANPTEVMELHTTVYNPNASTITVWFHIELWFYAEVYDILTQAQS